MFCPANNCVTPPFNANDAVVAVIAKDELIEALAYEAVCPTKRTSVPLTVKPPCTFTLPLRVCTSLNSSPNWLEPDE